MKQMVSRRDFLKGTAAVLAVSAAGVLAGCTPNGPAPVASAVIRLGEFEVTVTGDMELLSSDIVGDENAKSYLCKPRVRLQHEGNSSAAETFEKMFKAQIGETVLELLNEKEELPQPSGRWSKTVVPQFKASTNAYAAFTKGTAFKLYVTLQGQTAEFTLTKDGKVTAAPFRNN